MLAAGTAAQTSYSAVLIGLPVIGPALRDHYGLSLVEVGVVFDSVWVGGVRTRTGGIDVEGARPGRLLRR